MVGALPKPITSGKSSAPSGCVSSTIRGLKTCRDGLLALFGFQYVEEVDSSVHGRRKANKHDCLPNVECTGDDCDGFCAASTFDEDGDSADHRSSCGYWKKLRHPESFVAAHNDEFNMHSTRRSYVSVLSSEAPTSYGDTLSDSQSVSSLLSQSYIPVAEVQDQALQWDMTSLASVEANPGKQVRSDASL